ncbi:MAG: hypothetical protein UY18_C0050G0009 [Microgenomates group bacterium GW2011_GWF2_47_9]|nr:MAG: hypothetical protein UY18_C0050G0009 [Microgenomates group bacterium GW2011_GWF2_47_9]
MKIFEISRTISGANYSNLSAKATIDETEDFLTAFLRLDTALKNSLEAIEAEEVRQYEENIKRDNEKRRALAGMESSVDIPF